MYSFAFGITIVVQTVFLISEIQNIEETRFMNYILITIAGLLMTGFSGSGDKFPAASLKNLEGQMVNIHDVTADHERTIISFWASWCKPCKEEMDAISENYAQWQVDYGVEMIAITIDNTRGLAKVPGIIAAKDWPFTFLSDPNQELQHSLNFQTIPQTFVVDKDNNILYSHNSYSPGDEFELEKALQD